MDYEKHHHILPKMDWKRDFYLLVHFLWRWSEKSWMVSWLCKVYVVYSPQLGPFLQEEKNKTKNKNTHTLIVLANKHKLDDMVIPPNRTLASSSTNLITNMCLKNVDGNRL